MTISLPTEKRSRKQCRVRELAKIIGKLVSACPAMRFGYLYTKFLEQEKYLALKHSKGTVDQKFTVSSNLIRKDYVQLELFTDANCSVLYRIDNTTALTYINCLGGIQFPKLKNLARTIWQWAEVRNISLLASYQIEHLNFLHKDAEWMLADYAYQKLVTSFCCPVIDLFAIQINKKCRAYVGWQRDPDALAMSAFTLNWKNISFMLSPHLLSFYKL
nr:unnamed protein product [Callosobruchus chinensis]